MGGSRRLVISLGRTQGGSGRADRGLYLSILLFDGQRKFIIIIRKQENISACWLLRQKRAGQRERARQRERAVTEQTEKDRHRQTDSQADSQAGRQPDRQTRAQGW